MVLYIDAACSETSRTRKLAYSFLEDLGEHVREIRLYETTIPRLDMNAISQRREAAENNDLGNPFVRLATEFKEATKIIICAPYWDMGYPAILRAYIEAIMVESITFTYDEKGVPKGLCNASSLYYFTTAGGYIEKPDLGYSHIKELATKMLGIKNTYYYSAEGLDIDGANPDAIVDEEIRKIRKTYTKEPDINFDSYCVMAVDDSAVNVLKAEHILKENGYRTISAKSGAECLHKLKTQKPDLILLDINMPEMDGFATLDAIRSDPKTAKIPVVFVTGDNTLDNVLKASKHEVSGYVTKPFSENELMSHIRKIL